MAKVRLLLVGNPDPIHIGNHFMQAAKALAVDFRLCDSREAFYAPFLFAKINWWLRGHRPPKLNTFSNKIVDACRKFNPNLMLAIGIAPVEKRALIEIGKLKIARLNYLTDDPWNVRHWAPWFMEALPLYDYVFTPRKANITDLQKADCPKVFYLPFAYSPEVHFTQFPTIEEKERFESDIVFVGGADVDRISYINALIKSGFKVGLYGGYWERFPQTRKITHDQVGLETLRKAISATKVALCLVRRSNRDGHSMRTFEIPAIGTCMLTEDTEEHRDIFGEEGKAVVYFKTPSEMLSKVHWLLNNDDERKRLASTSHDLIIKGENRYSDRLRYMLGVAK